MILWMWRLREELSIGSFPDFWGTVSWGCLLRGGELDNLKETRDISFIEHLWMPDIAIIFYTFVTDLQGKNYYLHHV